MKNNKVEMENKMQALVKELKALIAKAPDMDIYELQYQAESLCERRNRILDKLLDDGIFEDVGEKEFSGIYKKFERAYEFEPHPYNRDMQSHLAMELDLGFGFDDEIRSVDDEDDLRSIQRSITDFIQKRSISGPDEEDPEFADILIKQEPVSFLEQDELMELASCLKGITHKFVDYIDYYRPTSWRWSADVLIISQYLFEFIAEVAYKTANCIDTDDLEYNIHDAFTYHEADVPEWLKTKLNEAVGTFENLMYDTINFIDKYDYHKLEYEAWLRPVFYNVGLLGMKFALEQEPEDEE